MKPYYYVKPVGKAEWNVFGPFYSATKAKAKRAVIDRIMEETGDNRYPVLCGHALLSSIDLQLPDHESMAKSLDHIIGNNVVPIDSSHGDIVRLVSPLVRVKEVNLFDPNHDDEHSLIAMNCGIEYEDDILLVHSMQSQSYEHEIASIPFTAHQCVSIGTKAQYNYDVMAGKYTLGKTRYAESKKDAIDEIRLAMYEICPAPWQDGNIVTRPGPLVERVFLLDHRIYKEFTKIDYIRDAVDEYSPSKFVIHAKTSDGFIGLYGNTGLDIELPIKADLESYYRGEVISIDNLFHLPAGKNSPDEVVRQLAGILRTVWDSIYVTLPYVADHIVDLHITRR